MNSVLFFDCETTGRFDFRAPFDAPHQPHLVQLAAMVATPERVLAQINFIVSPDGWDISDEVSKIHGIDNELAIAAGVPRRIALANFNQLCRLVKRVSAFNIAFDYPVLLGNFLREKQAHRLGPAMEKICAMMAATPVLKLPKPSGWKPKPGDEYKWPTLTEAHKHFFGCGFDGAHDAMNDVKALAAVYWKLEEMGAITRAA